MKDKNVNVEESSMGEDLQILRRKQIAHSPQQKRVAAYCRVSTDLAVQETSLETQMMSFRERIETTLGWTLVGIYADKGLSGTSAGKRVEFQRLIRDCEDGKVDYILAKSISRFARNTVDALSYTRKLKFMGVGVYFEQQNLDTLSLNSEIYLTIHAAFAQEESYSFSENMKRGIRNRFAMGIPKFSDTYGYRNSENGWLIYEEEAAVVREIFDSYLNGMSTCEITKELNLRGVRPPRRARTKGDNLWWEKTVNIILHNEKYRGDCEMQKSYTVDCLTHARKKNTDFIVPKYYKKGHHKPIIDPDDFETVQRIFKMRNNYRGCAQYPYYGLLKCPLCGGNMLRLRLPTRGNESAWFCADKCKSYAVKEKYIDKAVRDALKKADFHVPDKIEYRFLYDAVERITFSINGKTVDWNTLIVRWKGGGETNVTIEYGAPSDIPCTSYEYKDTTLFINEKVIKTKKAAAECLKRIAAFVEDTVIEDGDVPMVFTPNARKVREEA